MAVLYHDKDSLSLGGVCRYTLTYNKAQYEEQNPKSGVIDSLYLRVRNTSSYLCRAAYLQGPWTLCISVRNEEFDSFAEGSESAVAPYPTYDPTVKTGTSFWTALKFSETNKSEKQTWIVEIASQVLFAKINVPFTVTIGTSHDDVHAHNSSSSTVIFSTTPALTIIKQDTDNLWAVPKGRGKEDHLVILSHGLKSNLTADLLYLKESIEKQSSQTGEKVIVRGYNGNSLKTEKGIKYQGTKLSEYILKEAGWNSFTHSFESGPLYRKISFVGHSLGGCIQTFAIAHIQVTTAGEFFREIAPINFVTMATPWLGITSENPGYIRLALAFGVVGKTGWDMALTWRPAQSFDVPPSTIMKNALMSNEDKVKRERIRDPRPILQLLAKPQSPAHVALKLFKRHTVYANLVNDGIVPLRTAALFFLDWNSFDVSQVASHAPSKSPSSSAPGPNFLDNFSNLNLFGTKKKPTELHETSLDTPTHPSPAESPLSHRKSQYPAVQIPPNTHNHDGRRKSEKPDDVHSSSMSSGGTEIGAGDAEDGAIDRGHSNANPLLSLIALVRPQVGRRRSSKVWSRSQTVSTIHESASDSSNSTRKTSVMSHFIPPPKRQFIDSLSELFTPPLPSEHFINEPQRRKKTIFHDRVYHPSDIPPVAESEEDPLANVNSNNNSRSKSEKAKIRMEERIARDWHSDISWRKVLVRLEPEAHNNINVRRMFPNAYG